MKYCSKCGAAVAEEATSCPQCGFPFKTIRRKNWADVLGGIGLGLSIFSLVMGLLALIPILGLVFFYLAVVPGVVGLVFGILGCIKATSKGKCIAAIILSALGIICGSIGWAILIAAAATVA